MNKTWYSYFISYQYVFKGGTGFGNTDVVTDFEINNIKRVREIEAELRRKMGIEELGITNYQLMSKQDQP